MQIGGEKMKVTIINQHTNNFGDEAAGISLINNLFSKYNNLEVSLIYNGNGTIHYSRPNLHHLVDCKLKYMGYFNIFMKLIFHKYKGNKTMQDYDKVIKESDYIFVAPCGANIGIYKDWRFLIRILFVIFNDKKPIFHLNTIGASGNLLFDKIAKYVLKNSIVYVREKKSKQYLDKLGINCKLGIDTAFLFPYDKKIKKDNKKLTFVPSNLLKHKNFKDIDTEKLLFNKIIPQIAEFAKNNKLNIHILPHLNTLEEREMLNKIKLEFERWYNMKNVVIDQIDTVFDYYQKIAESYIVVGMRYHAVVLSAVANVPFLCLAYENKMIEVSNYTNKSKYCLSLYDKEFNEKNILKLLNAIKSDYKNYVESLIEVKKEITNLAELPLEVIK